MAREPFRAPHFIGSPPMRPSYLCLMAVWLPCVKLLLAEILVLGVYRVRSKWQVPPGNPVLAHTIRITTTCKEAYDASTAGLTAPLSLTLFHRDVAAGGAPPPGQRCRLGIFSGRSEHHKLSCVFNNENQCSHARGAPEPMVSLATMLSLGAGHCAFLHKGYSSFNILTQ